MSVPSRLRPDCEGAGPSSSAKVCFSTSATQIKYIVEVSDLRSHEREVDNGPCKLGNMAICVFVPTDEMYEEANAWSNNNATRMEWMLYRGARCPSARTDLIQDGLFNLIGDVPP